MRNETRPAWGRTEMDGLEVVAYSSIKYSLKIKSRCSSAHSSCVNLRLQVLQRGSVSSLFRVT